MREETRDKTRGRQVANGTPPLCVKGQPVLGCASCLMWSNCYHMPIVLLLRSWIPALSLGTYQYLGENKNKTQANTSKVWVCGWPVSLVKFVCLAFFSLPLCFYLSYWTVLFELLHSCGFRMWNYIYYWIRNAYSGDTIREERKGR